MARRLGLLLIALATGLAAAPNERERIVRSVDSLRARGELEKALVQASAAREQYPADIAIHSRYQDIRRRLGHEAQVRAEYRRNWRKHKTVESICLYARLLKGEAAVREYRHALRLDKHNYWAHYGIGVAYLRLGETEHARDHLERAHSINPRESAPKIRLGQLEEKAGRFQNALHYYQLAARVDSKAPDPLFHQVFALLALDRQAEAQEATTRLLRHPAVDAVALGFIARGVLKSARGDRKGAAKDFGAAVDKSARFGPHALVFYGDALSDLGQYDEAAGAYRRAIELDPGNLRARLGYGYLRYRRGEFKAADKEFDLALAEQVARNGNKACADCAAPLYFRGVIAEEQGRFGRALDFYQRAVRLDEEVADYHLALAALYERLDEPRRALKRYVKAAKLDPGDALSCFQAALIEADLRLGGPALKHLEEALKRDPELVDAYLTAGTVCQDLLARPQDALAWYKKYVKAGGTDKRVYEWIEELQG